MDFFESTATHGAVFTSLGVCVAESLLSGFSEEVLFSQSKVFFEQILQSLSLAVEAAGASRSSLFQGHSEAEVIAKNLLDEEVFL